MPRSTPLPDSPDERAPAHATFLSFLEFSKIDEMSPEEKVDWLRTVQFDDFMNLLWVSNGILTQRKKFEKWTEGDVVKSVVGGNGSDESYSLEPPENSLEEFQKFFEDMQANLNAGNMKFYAAKLYMAIVFSHMFPDGNGRTARHAYGLLASNKKPNEAVTLDRGEIITNICNIAGLQGMQTLFKQDGIEGNIQEHYVTIDGFSLRNYMDNLKYLAAKRALGLSEVTLPKVIELNTLRPDQKTTYELEYSKLRSEWFRAIQDFIDQHPEGLIKKLDMAILREANID